MPPKHLFLIGPETLDSLDQDEIDATVEGLKALDLYHLPYPRVAIRLPLDASGVFQERSLEGIKNTRYLHRDPDGKIRSNFGPHHWIQFDNVNLLGEPYICHFVCDGAPNWRPYDIVPAEPDSGHFMEALCDGLITLLATKNAVKTTVHNKLARLGIGRKRPCGRFEYVTTISLPAESDREADPDHPATGRTVAPHLRRGHIRRQHYGPERAFVKMVWIQPVFVNADPEFVNTRTRYNLGRRVATHSKKETA